MTPFRCRWASLTALVAYLAVHVGVAAFHYHHPQEVRRQVAAPDRSACLAAPASAEDDDDDHACPICNVLHLTQDLPTVVQAAAILAPTSETLSPPSVPRTHTLETSAYPRAPPFVEKQ